MLLRSRLTLVFALAVGLLLVTLLSAVALWRMAEQTRFNKWVLDTQQVNWNRSTTTARDRLRDLSAEIAHDPRLAAAILKHDAVAVRHAMATHNLDDARVDLFDDSGALAYTSSLNVVEEGQLDAGSIRLVLDSGEEVAGIASTGRDTFSFVVAVPVRKDGEVIGCIAMGVSVEPQMREMGAALASGVALVNLRGYAIGGDAAGLYNQIRPTLPLRKPWALEAVHEDRAYRVAALPVSGADRRQVGSFVTLHDVTSDRDREMRWLVSVAAVALALSAAILAAVFAQLRNAFAPLARAVEVLTALSRGDTGLRMDAMRLDEAGQIADGVGRLRSEMINLETLRDERARERSRQESIIRDELRELAGALDDASREEILADLDSALSDHRSEEGGNQLGVLTFVLGRLSGRIRDQQQRLRKLIDDLKEALRTKEAFIALQQELEIARRMQLSVLPRSFPARDDLALASFILPAKEVGGDFYDYFLLDDGRVGVIIADVSGKGVPAAFFMAICRTLLKVSAGFVDSPAAALKRVNDVLAAENDEMMFVTVFYGVLDPSSGRFVYASGGHTPAALRSGSDVRLLSPPGGMALAVVEDAQFAEGELTFKAGDVLFLYTDGVTEAQDPDNVLFGDVALLSALRDVAPDSPAGAYIDRVVGAVSHFTRGAPQADDITCLAVRYAGP